MSDAFPGAIFFDTTVKRRAVPVISQARVTNMQMNMTYRNSFRYPLAEAAVQTQELGRSDVDF